MTILQNAMLFLFRIYLLLFTRIQANCFFPAKDIFCHFTLCSPTWYVRLTLCHHYCSTIGAWASLLPLLSIHLVESFIFGIHAARVKKTVLPFPTNLKFHSRSFCSFHANFYTTLKKKKKKEAKRLNRRRENHDPNHVIEYPR